MHVVIAHYLYACGCKQIDQCSEVHLALQVKHAAVGVAGEAHQAA